MSKKSPQNKESSLESSKWFWGNTQGNTQEVTRVPSQTNFIKPSPQSRETSTPGDTANILKTLLKEICISIVFWVSGEQKNNFANIIYL